MIVTCVDVSGLGILNDEQMHTFLYGILSVSCKKDKKKKTRYKANVEQSQTDDLCCGMKIKCTALLTVDIPHAGYRAYQRITLYSVMFI